MKRWISAWFALAMTTTVASAQKVTTDSDRSAPFACYKTYAWTAGTPAPSAFDEQRIHQTVEAELATKKMTRADRDPNLYVATHLLAYEQREIIADRFGPSGFGRFSTASVASYRPGTLIVDLYDAITRKMVWRGTATATASDTPSKNARKINNALATMFQQYPPSGTSTVH